MVDPPQTMVPFSYFHKHETKTLESGFLDQLLPESWSNIAERPVPGLWDCEEEGAGLLGLFFVVWLLLDTWRFATQHPELAASEQSRKF
jgi:hypothetical protein